MSSLEAVITREIPLIIKDELQKVERGKYRGVVIYPPTIDWGTLHQRPQQIMKYFARAGYLAFYCTPNHDSIEVEGFKNLEQGLYLTDNFKKLTHLQNPVVIVTWPNHEQLIHEFTGNPILVYEVIDELSLFGSDENPEVILWDKTLTRVADVITATANSLLEKKIVEREDTILVENGADIRHFLREVHPSEIPLDIQAIQRLGKPIIGYYGALAEWFDYDLFFEAAKRRPDLSFVLIGRDYHNNGFLQKKLETAPNNVYYIGGEQNRGVPYETLPGYLKAFDVATIPFDQESPIIKSTSPVKLFEYMAGGKPVVTTDFPEARKYSVVLRARDFDSFIQAIDRALSLRTDSSYLSALIETAQTNSWEARVERITTAIQKVERKGVHGLELYRIQKQYIDRLLETAQAIVSKDPQEAIKIYQAILTLNPDQPLVELELGKVYLYTLKDFSHAIFHLEKVSQTLRASGWAHNYLGEAYLRNGNYAEGESALEHALQIPDYNGSQTNATALLENHKRRLRLHDEAQILYRYGHSDQALEVYRQILNLSEQDRLADFEIGKIYLERKDYDSAELHFRKAISLVPDSSWSYIYLGIALLEKGDKETAKSTFQEALRYSTTDLSLKENIAAWMIRC